MDDDWLNTLKASIVDYQEQKMERMHYMATRDDWISENENEKERYRDERNREAMIKGLMAPKDLNALKRKLVGDDLLRPDRREEFEAVLDEAEAEGGALLGWVETQSQEHAANGHAHKMKGCVNCLADDSIPWAVQKTNSMVSGSALPNTHWDPGVHYSSSPVSSAKPHFTFDPEKNKVYEHLPLNSSSPSYIHWET